MRIIDCKTNHMTSPLGYSMDRPVFSYVVTEAQGKRQTEARIRVSRNADMSACLLDTGFRADIESLAYAADIELAPRTRYYWDVCARSDAGEEATSDVNWFETGKRGEGWAGKWITCEDGRHPIFYTALPIEKTIRDARLYICGLGLYEAYLNGESVSAEKLTPYCNDYEMWLQYQTYDITAALAKGGKLEVLLGNGWYKSRFGFDVKLNKTAYFSDTWKLIAEVRVRYADGSEAVFGTDENWNVRRSQITESSIYDGEVYDATLPETAPEKARLCLETLAPLVDRYSTPVTVHEQLAPIELIHTPAGETVLDLGQNMAGIFRLRVAEPAGTRVFLQFGEVLQCGNFYRENLRSAKAEYTYISDGKERVIEPHFTFYGYRYVKIEGIPALQKEDFTGLVLYSELPKTGTLRTGNELINRLILNTEWGQVGNFIDVPTDCPQRDERMGWTGDAQVFSPTACFLRDCYAFYRKYLFDMWQEQQKKDGLVPNVVPSVGNQGCATVWGDAATIIPWNVYQFYGDETILADQFESMKAWVDYITRAEADGHAFRNQFHFGDWLALDNPKGGVDQVLGATSTDFIACAYYLNSARIVARAARVLGKEAEARQYEALSEAILADIRDEFYSKNGRCCLDTQTAHLLTLEFGLSTAPERAREALVRKFAENNDKLTTGFVGTSILCNRLSAEGMDDLAYKLLLNEEYPGWLYEVKLGATTIWERWNSVLPDGSISSTGMNSLNHYAYGAVVEWIYRHAAGINPTAPGFRSVRLNPKPNRALRCLEAECRTAAGTYRIAWNVPDDKHVELAITVPFHCDATLVLPYAPPSVYEDKANPLFADVRDGICYIGAGEYRVAYETDRLLRKVLSTYDTLATLLDHPRAKELIAAAFPQVELAPPHIRGQSPRQLLEHMQPQHTQEELDALDAVLATLE